MDVGEETVERYTDPSTDTYRRVERTRRGETTHTATLSHLELRADEVLG